MTSLLLFDFWLFAKKTDLALLGDNGDDEMEGDDNDDAVDEEEDDFILILLFSTSYLDSDEYLSAFGLNG